MDLAEAELQIVLELIERGEWPPLEDSAERTFGEYVDEMQSLAAKAKSADDIPWRIRHLASLREFHPSQIDRRIVMNFRSALIEGIESEHINPRVSGTDHLTEPRRIRPLANESINKILEHLARVLRAAWDLDKVGPGPDVCKNLALDVPRRKFGWLEYEDVEPLLAAARHCDRWPHWDFFLKAREIARLRDDLDLPWREVVRRSGTPQSSAWYQHDRFVTADRDVIGEVEAVLTVGIATGARAAELAHFRIGDLRPGEQNGIWVDGTKSVNAERKASMGPYAMGRIIEYLHQPARKSHGPRSPLLLNQNGDPHTRETIRGAVKRAATRAVLLADIGLGPHINTIKVIEATDETPLAVKFTAHDLRRTYVALLFSKGFDRAFVQDSVGHSRSDVYMTEYIYNRVVRQDRSANWAALEAQIYSGARGQEAHLDSARLRG